MTTKLILRNLVCLLIVFNSYSECPLEVVLKEGHCPGMEENSIYTQHYESPEDIYNSYGLHYEDDEIYNNYDLDYKDGERDKTYGPDYYDDRLYKRYGLHFENDEIYNRYGQLNFRPQYQNAPIGLTSSELLTIGATASTALLLFNNDAELMQFVQDNRTEITEEVAFWGEKAGSMPIGISAAGYVLGAVVQNDEIKRIAKVALKATAISGLITRAGKMTFSRVRPNKTDDPNDFNGFQWDNDNVSFPSGHTTTAFAFATVIAEHYKDKSSLIPVLAYSAAAVGGWSRVHDRAHWASDVAVGALVGHLTGKLLYADEYGINRNKKWDMSIYPVVTHNYAGIQFEFRGRKKRDRNRAKEFKEDCIRHYEQNPPYPYEDVESLCFRHYLTSVYKK